MSNDSSSNKKSANKLDGNVFNAPPKEDITASTIRVRSLHIWFGTGILIVGIIISITFVVKYEGVADSQVLPVNQCSGYVFFVSPGGNDENPGTIGLPFKTPQRARDVVRAITKPINGVVKIFLRGGRYELANTLIFDERDSGEQNSNVIYQAFPGEKPSLSGGRVITGWVAVANGIYKAYIGSLRFRQLYVGNERAIRAREPDESYYRIISWDTQNKRIKVSDNTVRAWQQLNEVEMVVQRHWDQDRLRIEGFIQENGDTFIIPAEPERSRMLQVSRPPDANQPYHFENAFEFLDMPGEWYLNTVTNEVFYKPRLGEKMTEVTVIAPVIETLVEIKGRNLNAVAHNLQFRGITFEHTTWTLPSIDGYVGGQANSYFANGSQMGARIPAGIHIQNAESIVFDRNTFQHMGGMALKLHSGTRNNEIIGNVILDIAGNGISIDSDIFFAVLNSKDDVVKNNFIHKVGQDYYGSVGIFAGYTDSTIIEHNEISNTPYSGISAGWGWTDQDTVLKNNKIKYNDIYNTMNLLADGAAIYTLSKQPGTHIFENYIHDIVRSSGASSYPIAGIYLDQGSSFITVENNVLQNVPPKKIHKNLSGTPVPNNTLINNDSFLQSIADNSGLELQYADIAEGVIDGNAAAFFSQNVTPSMLPNQLMNVSITMKNIGNTTWTRGQGYKLGSQNPQDNLTWDIDRVLLTQGETINPGETKTFSFTIRAPLVPGVYNFQWRMIQENVTWFGDNSTNIKIFTTNIQQASSLGVFRQSTSEWLFDRNSNGTWDGCDIDRCANFGSSGDQPVVGDWNGDGKLLIGVFRDGSWHLDLNGNGIWDGCGIDRCFNFGLAGDYAVVGDWNGSGTYKIGVFRNATWFLDTNGSGTWDGCSIDTCINWGLTNDLPIVGTWNNNNKTAIGTFRSSTNATWFLDGNGDNVFTDCSIDRCISSSGEIGDSPVIGDWDGDGIWDIGMFDVTEGRWYLDNNGNGAFDSCILDSCIRFGLSGDMPIVGNWRNLSF